MPRQKQKGKLFFKSPALPRIGCPWEWALSVVLSFFKAPIQKLKELTHGLVKIGVHHPQKMPYRLH
jgi:hypothetical protein